MKTPKIIPDVKIHFGKWLCEIRIGQYQNNGRIAFELIDHKDHSPIAKVTVNQSLEPKPDKYWIDIKNYSENTGMVEAFHDADIIGNHLISVGVAMRAKIIHPEIKKVMDEFYETL